MGKMMPPTSGCDNCGSYAVDDYPYDYEDQSDQAKIDWQLDHLRWSINDWLCPECWADPTVNPYAAEASA